MKWALVYQEIKAWFRIKEVIEKEEFVLRIGRSDYEGGDIVGKFLRKIIMAVTSVVIIKNKKEGFYNTS